MPAGYGFPSSGKRCVCFGGLQLHLCVELSVTADYPSDSIVLGKLVKISIAGSLFPDGNSLYVVTLRNNSFKQMTSRKNGITPFPCWRVRILYWRPGDGTPFIFLSGESSFNIQYFNKIPIISTEIIPTRFS
jgi:hypothetical protein